MTAKASYIVDRVLHWLSALAILLLLTDMGTRIHYVDYQIKGIVQHKQDAIEVHMTYALVLFIVLLARLGWRKWFLDQAYQTTYHNNKHKWLVTTVHSAMYLILFSLMASGVLMVTNYDHAVNFYQLFTLSEVGTDHLIFTEANSWHLWFEALIYLLLVLHIAGAIYQRR